MRAPSRAYLISRRTRTWLFPLLVVASTLYFLASINLLSRQGFHIGKGEDQDILDLFGSNDEDKDEDRYLYSDAAASSTGEEFHSDHVTCYKSPMLPEKQYTIIGLESSGTKFVTDVIREAVGLEFYREGANKFVNKRKQLLYELEDKHTHVQHLSLPFGSFCSDKKLKGKEVPIVDVILPPQCVRERREVDSDEVKRCCDPMVEELLGFNPNGGAVKYPLRWNLDIVSHKEWWDAHGVEQWVIIVLRDKDISASSRVAARHCQVKDLLEKEEQAGTDIIIDAINKYIIGDENAERKVTSDNYEFWYAERFQRRKLGGIYEDVKGVMEDVSSMILSKNRVVVVSYESMMLLGDVYFKAMFKTLGIETDFIPDARNGNSRYVKGSPYASDFSPTRTEHRKHLRLHK